MPKLSSVHRTQVYRPGANGWDITADQHIFKLFEKLNSGWHMYNMDGDTTNNIKHRFIYKEPIGDSNTTIGFSFPTLDSSTKLKFRIEPSLFTVNTNGVVTWLNSTINGWVSDNYMGPWSSTTLSSDGLPTESELPEESSYRYTVYESKNKRAWTVSMVQSGQTFECISGIVGIDSAGQLFCLAAGGDYAPDKYMEINSPDMLWINGTYPSTNGEIIQKHGIGPVSSSLTLIPYVNPHNGAICEDLYISDCGPMSTFLYDFEINNRHFITGSSNSTINKIPAVDVTMNQYHPEFKIYMEV